VTNAEDGQTYGARLGSDPIYLIGNEWNVPGDARFPDSDDAFVDLWNAVAPGIHETAPEARLYTGGMFSEPDVRGHMHQVFPRLLPTPTGIDFHPYLDTVEDIERILTDARTQFECEIGVGEWHWEEPTEIAGFHELLEGLTDYSFWYSWSDGMKGENEEPMGLVSTGGRYKTVGRAYREALKSG
jgi:hypothetical protein